MEAWLLEVAESFKRRALLWNNRQNETPIELRLIVVLASLLMVGHILVWTVEWINSRVSRACHELVHIGAIILFAIMGYQIILQTSQHNIWQ